MIYHPGPAECYEWMALLDSADHRRVDRLPLWSPPPRPMRAECFDGRRALFPWSADHSSLVVREEALDVVADLDVDPVPMVDGDDRLYLLRCRTVLDAIDTELTEYLVAPTGERLGCLRPIIRADVDHPMFSLPDGRVFVNDTVRSRIVRLVDHGLTFRPCQAAQ